MLGLPSRTSIPMSPKLSANEKLRNEKDGKALPQSDQTRNYWSFPLYFQRFACLLSRGMANHLTSAWRRQQSGAKQPAPGACRYVPIWPRCPPTFASFGNRYCLILSAFLPDLHRSLNTHRLSSCSATQKWATDPGTGACGLKWLGPSRDSLYRKKLRRAIQSWVCSKISFIYSCLLGCHLLFLLLKEGSEASREGQVLRKALVGWQEESSVVTNRKI